MIMAAVFFIPSALLFAELGTAFPEEGGPYIWTRIAFGRLAGAINNFLYWVTNPVWLGGTLAVAAATAFTTFFTSSVRARTRAVLCLHAPVRVGRRPRGDPVVQGRQVDPDARRLVALPAARLLLRLGRGLRGAERRQRLLVPVRLLTDLRRRGRARPGADVPVRRLRAAQQRGRRDEEPAEGRALGDQRQRDRRDPALRHPDPRDPARPAHRPGDGPRGLHRRDQVRVHRVRGLHRRGRHGGAVGPRPRPRRSRRHHVHPVAAVVGRRLDHGLGPCARGVGVRRGRPSLSRRHLREVRHPGARQRVQRDPVDARPGARPRDHPRRRRQAVHHGARARRVDDAAQLPRHLSGPRGAAAQAARRRPSVQGADADAALGLAHDPHRVRDGAGVLPRARRRLVR